MSEEELLLRGWRLATAKIFYYWPDAPKIVNPNWFLWQRYDRAPDFPALNEFLDWWEATLDGGVHSVQIAVFGLIAPTDLTCVNGEYRLR